MSRISSPWNAWAGDTSEAVSGVVRIDVSGGDGMDAATDDGGPSGIPASAALAVKGRGNRSRTRKPGMALTWPGGSDRRVFGRFRVTGAPPPGFTDGDRYREGKGSGPMIPLGSLSGCGTAAVGFLDRRDFRSKTGAARSGPKGHPRASLSGGFAGIPRVERRDTADGTRTTAVRPVNDKCAAGPPSTPATRPHTAMAQARHPEKPAREPGLPHGQGRL